MTPHVSLLVPGAEPDGGPVPVTAPFDGSLIATVETGGGDAVNKALATAHGLFRNRDAWLSPATRIDILERTAALMKERRDELASAAAREGGKPMMDSLVEANRAVDCVKICVETLRTQSGRVIPMGLSAASEGRLAFTQHEPIGVVVAFSAFNHPLNLIAHQVAPAIAAGCPVIVKPARATPLSCMRFVEILREAGLPDVWCQGLLTKDHETAGSLACDGRVAFFTFIGSGRVGWALRSRLAPGTRCTLEHGGVAPVIVAEDADLDEATPLLAKGGFYHAGQVCVSVQRIFAHQRIARTLADRLAAKAESLRVGDPTLSETEVGPLIRHAEVERVDAWVKEAVAGGGELVCGGQATSKSCYAPTVLFDPPADARVSTLEVFGPVVCVCPFEHLEEAVAKANSLPFAFQAALFTRNLDTALGTARRLDAASVMVNEHTAFRVDWMPFAGLRESGLGVGGIPHTIKDMQIEKLVVIRSKGI